MRLEHIVVRYVMAEQTFTPEIIRLAGAMRDMSLHRFVTEIRDHAATVAYVNTYSPKTQMWCFEVEGFPVESFKASDYDEAVYHVIQRHPAVLKQLHRDLCVKTSLGYFMSWGTVMTKIVALTSPRSATDVANEAQKPMKGPRSYWTTGSSSGGSGKIAEYKHSAAETYVYLCPKSMACNPMTYLEFVAHFFLPQYLTGATHQHRYMLRQIGATSPVSDPTID